ncbi:terpene cyclase [Taiwanofungus camphoratus]|nr:terpene cyclase [Antrodia cinnamomea]
MRTNSIRLPNLISFCENFELRTNRHCRAVTATSTEWALKNGLFDKHERCSFTGLQLGLLASLCYPTCDAAQLLLTTKFIVILHYWAGESLASDSAERAFNEIWHQLPRASANGWQIRSQRHLHSFRTARARAVSDNDQDITPDLESYIITRKDSSGLKMLFDLIECAEGLRIPAEIYTAPMLQRLRSDAANIISWSNDIAAYPRNPASEKHNLVAALMVERRVSAQNAIDVASNLVKKTIDNFLTNERLLSVESFGPGVTADVHRYVQGLRDWIVGSTHWLYETELYFRDSGAEVRDFGWAFVAPKS